jgi:hypothetical protein
MPAARTAADALAMLGDRVSVYLDGGPVGADPEPGKTRGRPLDRSLKPLAEPRVQTDCQGAVIWHEGLCEGKHLKAGNQGNGQVSGSGQALNQPRCNPQPRE